jgi:ABC-2 type transport system ATP-binding protein
MLISNTVAAAEAGPAIQLSDVRKSYGPKTALDGISLTIEQGHIVALLGPNGAGKSTLIRLILGLGYPTSGEVVVQGATLTKAGGPIYQAIGYVPQESVFDSASTPRRELMFQGKLFGISKASLQQRVQELLEQFQLIDVAQNPIRTLSGGTRRRLDLAGALLHRPDILILDEPTQGLDPESRSNLWEALRELNRSGLTILFATHDLDEADRSAHRVVIMDQGRTLGQGEPAEMKAELADDILIATLSDLCFVPELLASKSLQKMGAWADNEVLFVPLRESSAQAWEILDAIAATGARVARFEIVRPSLEAVYLRHAGRRFEETKPAKEAIPANRWS